MNVLVISNLYPRPGNASYGIFIHVQVRQLQQLGYNITVLAPVPWSPKILHSNAKWLSYGQAPSQIMWEDVEVYYPRYLRLPGPWFRAVAGITAYWGLLFLALRLHKKQSFDLIHSNFIFPNGIAALYLSRKLKVPTVCSVRGNDILTEPFENPLNRYYAKRVIQETDQLVTVSQALKRTVEQLAEPTQPVKVVYNGVDIAKFQAKSLINQKKDKIKQHKPYMLFVGQDIRRKGLRDLLEAFAQLVDGIEHRLIVIGPSPVDVQRLDRHLFETLKDRLVIAGPLPPDEIPVYMQNCEMLILPSYEEGLPNVVLEAMACGKAVIATDISGTPEAVVDNKTGLLISPNQPLQLAEAIKTLLDNPERARRMGERGQERLMSYFTWPRHVAEMAAIYEYVVRRRAAKHESG